jgi:hypothetical protein
MNQKQHLLEDISVENQWRVSDFANMKRTYENLSASEDLQKMFLRMCVPYLYAHWEGFAMSSLKLLIKYFNDLRLAYHDVKIHLFVLSLNDKFAFLKGKQSFEQKCEFSSNFIEYLATELKFDKKNVSSKSNLNDEVLKELCQIFGFDAKKFEPHLTGLNQLVNVRNSIAHGENGYKIDLDKLENYIKLVNNLIFTLQEEIKIYVEQEKYLR